jgi:hypothetical protein
MIFFTLVRGRLPSLGESSSTAIICSTAFGPVDPRSPRLLNKKRAKRFRDKRVGNKVTGWYTGVLSQRLCAYTTAWEGIVASIHPPLTFIISTTVFKAIMAMMVYSKDGDTTKCHTRYWKVCLFCGM